MSFSLNLYSPILDGATHIANITREARNWTRSIRLQGGYWLGGFRMYDTRSNVRDFFMTKLGYHTVEKFANQTTWEGMISSLYPQDQQKPYYIDVTVSGYVFTSAWRYVAPSMAPAQADVWMTNLVNLQCEFLELGTINENTVIVETDPDIDIRVWDEINRVVELGDASGNPWRFYVNAGRKGNYEQISTTPSYYARGGILRSRSLDTMWNNVASSYTDVLGNIASIAASSNLVSIGRYGRRDYIDNQNNVTSAAATARRDTILKSSAWPYPRPIGSIANIQLYDAIGSDITTLSPWQIAPGVIRDLAWPAGGVESGGWLLDGRDILVDEITATRAGVTFKGYGFDESEIFQFVPITDVFEMGAAGGRTKDLPHHEHKKEGIPHREIPK